MNSNNPDLTVADVRQLSHKIIPLSRGVAEGRGVYTADKEHTPESPLKRGL
jgi:hypothetical protein